MTDIIFCLFVLFCLSFTGYRVNKFCGEHLIIANESPVPDPTYHPTQQRSPSENDIEIDSSGNENKLDGPVAEALIQNEQMFHQLKIWKPSPSELENERKKAAAVNNAYKQPSIRKGVYSQVCNFSFINSLDSIRRHSTQLMNDLLHSSL